MILPGIMADIRKKVLLISSEEQILAFLEKVFQGNFIVIRAVDVAAGVEISRREGPDAVVLDIDGPGIDVVKHVQQFKGSGAGAMVWTLCLKDNVETAKRSLLAGAVGYVLKPYSGKDWEKVISNISTGRLPDREEPVKALKVQTVDVQADSGWKASRSGRVLAGIVAGIGYTSVPFYLLMFITVNSCVGVSSEYCARNGNLACGIYQSAFAYFLLLGPFILPVGIAAIIVNVIFFLTKKRLSRIDWLVLALGAGAVGIVALSPQPPLGCGIM